MIGPGHEPSEIPVFIGPMSHQEELTLAQRQTGQELETGISGFLTKQTRNKDARKRFEKARKGVTKGRSVEESDYRSIVESLGYKYEGPKADSMYFATYHLLSLPANLNAIWEKQSPEDQEKVKAIGGGSKDLADYLIALDLNEEDLKVLLNSIK